MMIWLGYAAATAVLLWGIGFVLARLGDVFTDASRDDYADRRRK